METDGCEGDDICTVQMKPAVHADYVCVLQAYNEVCANLYIDVNECTFSFVFVLLCLLFLQLIYFFVPLILTLMLSWYYQSFHIKHFLVHVHF